MGTFDQALIHKILREIDTYSSQGIVPVHNGHLQHMIEEGEILDYLLYMKREKLISGDLVTKGVNSTPHRLTNIRLTYFGIKTLRS